MQSMVADAGGALIHFLCLTNILTFPNTKYHTESKHTTHGVRRWPLNTFKQRPVWQLIILTVWSPLECMTDLSKLQQLSIKKTHLKCGVLRTWAYCVEARVFPSGLKAAAIVDLGGGTKGQYFADKCLSDSASALNFVKPREKNWT